MDIKRKLQEFYLIKYFLVHRFDPVLETDDCASRWVASPTGDARVFVDVHKSGEIVYTADKKFSNSEQLLTEIKNYIENDVEPNPQKMTINNLERHD